MSDQRPSNDSASELDLGSRVAPPPVPQRSTGAAPAHRWLIQVAIILVVFPATLTAICAIVGFPIEFVARLLSTRLGDWAGPLDLVNTIFSVALGLIGALWVCKLAWPKPVVKAGASISGSR